MAKVSVYNMEGKQIDTIELSDAVFGVEVNEHLVHMAVVQQLANNRQGNTESKDPFRGFRRRKKTWRQKGPVMQDRAPSALLSGQAAA